MSRLLHWTLLGGCALLVALFSPLAWQSVLACEFPVDCRAAGNSSELASHALHEDGIPQIEEASTKAPRELSSDDTGETRLPMVGTLALGGDLLGGSSAR